ncbi:MAG: histidine kinase [Nitrosarchaeum sp.]
MKTPEIVPEKLDNPIDFRILIIIGIVVIGFHILVNNSEESDMLIYSFSMIIPLSVSIFGFIVAKRYAGTLVYSRAYLMLALAFLMMFGAEATYFVYEQILELDPYPSIADVFFFVFYPLLILYLVINIRFFASQVTKSAAAIIVGIPAAITAIYINLTIADAGSFDFYYGIIFVAAASTTLSLSIHTARIFKGGLIGTAWLVLVIGIMLNVVGDTWYYYIEVGEGYTLDHPVNLFWYSAYLLILYALYKHKKSL